MSACPQPSALSRRAPCGRWRTHRPSTGALYPMPDSPPSITELAVQLRTGALTSRALTESYLGRIADSRGEGSRTFVSLHARRARDEADAIDRRRTAGET